MPEKYLSKQSKYFAVNGEEDEDIAASRIMMIMTGINNLS
jgi:hypothetical protein